MSHFVTHLRVVTALLIRETATRFGNKPGGYVWAIVDPAAHIVFMTLIFTAITHAPPLGTNFPLFFATGYMGYQFYNAMVVFMNGAIRANRSLLSYPNVAPIDTVVARYILQLSTTTLVALLVLSVIHGMMYNPTVLYWPAILEAVFAGSVLALGVALFNNVMFLQYPLYEHLFGIVTRPLFLLSGVFFLPDSIPHPYREIVLYNPIVHVIMLFRTGFYPEYRASGMDMDYLYTCALVGMFVGLAVFTTSAAVLRSR